MPSPCRGNRATWNARMTACSTVAFASDGPVDNCFEKMNVSAGLGRGDDEQAQVKLLGRIATFNIFFCPCCCKYVKKPSYRPYNMSQYQILVGYGIAKTRSRRPHRFHRIQRDEIPVQAWFSLAQEPHPSQGIRQAIKSRLPKFRACLPCHVSSPAVAYRRRRFMLNSVLIFLFPSCHGGRLFSDDGR
jgi:hypothetical protein